MKNMFNNLRIGATIPPHIVQLMDGLDGNWESLAQASSIFLEKEESTEVTLSSMS